MFRRARKTKPKVRKGIFLPHRKRRSDGVVGNAKYSFEEYRVSIGGVGETFKSTLIAQSGFGNGFQSGVQRNAFQRGE